MSGFKLTPAESILSSEMYAAKAGALNGIESVRTNAPTDARYERNAAKNGQPMFNLKAANNEVIGTSETALALRDLRK